MKWAKKQTGFTIVELLIVVVVIAILAAVTIVAYNGIQNRAKESAAQSAASQLQKKILTYAVDNADNFPEATGTNGTDLLRSLGFVSDGATTYQYSANNNSSPRTFCITATVNNKSFYQNNSTQTTPVAGACDGHGVDGVPPITNLATNPGCEANTAALTPYGGGIVSRQASGTAASGSYVCRIMRGTQGAGLLLMIYPVNYQANTPFSIRFKARLAPGSSANLGVSAGTMSYDGGMGVGAPTGCTAVAPAQLSTTTWSDITIQGCTTPNVTMNRIGVQLTPRQTWQPTDGLEIDSIIIVRDSTAPQFADGSTSGWVWNGTPHESTSTGRPL